MNFKKLHIDLYKFPVLMAAFVGMSLFPVKMSYSSYIMNDPAKKIHFFQPVIDSLLKNGADTAFVYSLITDTKTQFNERYVRINVTNYFRELDLSDNFNAYSVKKTMEFLEENKDLLSNVERYYNIPKEVVAAILWIESKYGKILGDNHLPSVFLSTALANEPEFVKMNKEALHNQLNHEGDTSKLPELETLLAARAAKKASWAVHELLALERINKTSTINVKNLYGSWAGAFGLSQFLPSSYLKWAVDGNCNGNVNLFELQDAAFSVGNYLKNNGWGQTSESQRDAIFSYNNSDEYVDAVLKLASKLKVKQQANNKTDFGRNY